MPGSSRKTVRSGAETEPGADPRRAAEALFGSPTLVDVLEIFCRNPSRRYYVNELIKLTGRFPRSVQLALERLEAVGIIQAERQANAKFFRVVEDHPFYPELASIVTKIPNLHELLRQNLARLRESGVIRVAFLRPAETDSTELEVVVIGTAARLDLDPQLEILARQLGRPIHLDYFSIEEWEREARRQRSFVRWLLEEPRTYLVGGDADLPGVARGDPTRPDPPGRLPAR